MALLDQMKLGHVLSHLVHAIDRFAVVDGSSSTGWFGQVSTMPASDAVNGTNEVVKSERVTATMILKANNSNCKTYPTCPKRIRVCRPCALPRTSSSVASKSSICCLSRHWYSVKARSSYSRYNGRVLPLFGEVASINTVPSALGTPVAGAKMAPVPATDCGSPTGKNWAWPICAICCGCPCWTCCCCKAAMTLNGIKLLAAICGSCNP